MSRFDLIDVTDANVSLLREVNSVLFPSAPYNYFFYISILDDDNALAKLIYYEGKLAGGMTARLDTSVKKLRQFYIITLGVLQPYRRLGLGTKLMQHILNYTEDNGKFNNIFLHVQMSNVTAIQFYTKFGFEIREKLENYYKPHEPAGAFVLQKTLKKSSKKRQIVDIEIASTSRIIKRRTKPGNR